MEEEEEPVEPLSLDHVEDLAKSASASLRREIGVSLPRLSSRPPAATRHIEYVPFGIELPMGSLFYPCCGSDIDHAMSAFGPYVLDCHFADPYQTVRNRSRRARNLKKISVPGVEDVVVGGAGGERIDNAACVAYSHAKDGLLTLIEDIGALSVFYYRGDSGGEGGSNQRWLGPILFHTVLARLLDGGLIATDGSNCGAAHEGQQVLWAPICAPSTAEPAPFVYAHREFRYVGELTDQDPDRPRRKLVRLWQVRSEQKRV